MHLSISGARGTSGRIRNRQRPLTPALPRAWGPRRSQRAAERRPELGTRTGASQCLCPTLPALCFPFGVEHRRMRGTHTQWDGPLQQPLVSVIRRTGVGFAGPSAWRLLHQIQPRSRPCWFIVHLGLDDRRLRTGRSVLQRDTTGLCFVSEIESPRLVPVETVLRSHSPCPL